MTTTLAPPKRKIMVYMPGDLVDDVDDYRHMLRILEGVRFDRSALISEAVRYSVVLHPARFAVLLVPSGGEVSA
jgi:3',5'-cyclic AMP phosphodiesterase CpdA